MFESNALKSAVYLQCSRSMSWPCFQCLFSQPKKLFLSKYFVTSLFFSLPQAREQRRCWPCSEWGFLWHHVFKADWILWSRALCLIYIEMIPLLVQKIRINSFPWDSRWKPFEAVQSRGSGKMSQKLLLKRPRNVSSEQSRGRFHSLIRHGMNTLWPYFCFVQLLEFI